MKNTPAVVVDVPDLEERAGAVPVLHLKDDKTLSPKETTLKYRRPAFMIGVWPPWSGGLGTSLDFLQPHPKGDLYVARPSPHPHIPQHVPAAVRHHR